MANAIFRALGTTIAKPIGKALATGLGTGLLPWVPGTWGTLAAYIIAWFWLSDMALPFYLAGLVAALLFGVWLCAQAIDWYDDADPKMVVWDEWVGAWIALVALPKVFWLWVVSFVLFRVLDMMKPAFIGWADRKVGGGLGIMLDDVLAGVVALLLAHLAYTVWVVWLAL